MKIWPLIISAIMVVSLMGCGISRQDYDELKAELRIAEAHTAEVESQIRDLKERYELVGETPTDTARRIVSHYHETHIYSTYDFFVCGDMSLDVWDMLKACGIDALIQIGNVEKGAKDITEIDHAWVMAEVSPGQYLALETTGGYIVLKKDNPLYYEGWSFDNPREYKRFAELRYEYNTRVAMLENLRERYEALRTAWEEAGAEYQRLAQEAESISLLDPGFGQKLREIVIEAEECGTYRGRYEQVTELVSELADEIQSILAEMRELFG